MKAKEYFEKYETAVMGLRGELPEEQRSRVLGCLMQDLLDEANVLAEQRKVRTPEGLMGCLNEQNDKWNTIAKLFAEKGCDALKRNALREYWAEAQDGRGMQAD